MCLELELFGVSFLFVILCFGYLELEEIVPCFLLFEEKSFRALIVFCEENNE